MLSAPTRTAPAASSRSISVASRADGSVVAVDLRARERRKTRDVEQILDRERHAGERPERFALAASLIQRAGFLARAVGDHSR